MRALEAVTLNNSQVQLLIAHGCLRACPTVLFKGPIGEDKKQRSGDSWRLVDPHTNMGSLTLAVMGTQCVCVGGSLLAHHGSLPLAPGLAECYLYMNIQQQPTYSKSFQKALVTSTLA